MTEPKKVTVDGVECMIGKFGAEQGWRLVHKLVKGLGPALAHFSSGNFRDGLKELVESIGEGELIALIKELTSVVLVDGKKFSNTDLANYSFTIEVCAHVIKENFGDFFSQVIDSLAATRGQGMNQKA